MIPPETELVITTEALGAVATLLGPIVAAGIAVVLGWVFYKSEVRFARLHEKRLSVIAEMYGRIARAHLYCESVCEAADRGSLSADLRQNAENAWREAVYYFTENRLFLEDQLSNEIEKICQELDEIRQKSISEAGFDYLIAKRQLQGVPNILSKLRAQFQKVLDFKS